MHRLHCLSARHVGTFLTMLTVVSLLASLSLGMLVPLSVNAAGPNLTRTASTVVSLIARGNDTAAERYFAPILQAAAPAPRLRQIWQQLTAQVGAFERQTGVAEQTTNGIQSVFVHCVFARDTADVVISFDTSGLVDGLHVANIQLIGSQATFTTTQPATTISSQAALIRVLTIRPLQTAWFAPSFLAVLPIGHLAQALANIMTELGPYQSLTSLPDGGYRVHLRDGTIDGRIHLDANGHIDGLGFTNIQLSITGLHAARTTSTMAGRAALVDSLLTQRLQNHQFSGSVLVAVNGKVLLARGYGYADAATKRPNTINTEFRIGSITKQFTAMAILELQAAGKLSVHDKLCQYVPSCPSAWTPITLQELLSHTSGIANYTGLPAYSSGMNKPITATRIIELLKPLALDFAPGTKFEYSNSNFYLLGYIVAKVSGESYATYLQQGIFDPLLLQQTGYDTNHPDPGTHALGYTSWSNGAPFVDISWPYAAGALYSSVGDLWHWDQALMSDTLISKTSTANMLAAHATTCGSGVPCPYNSITAHYGDGWFRGTLGGHLVINHGGDINGFTAMNAFVPDAGITIVLLSNQANSGASSFLGQALLQIMLGQS